MDDAQTKPHTRIIGYERTLHLRVLLLRLACVPVAMCVRVTCACVMRCVLCVVCRVLWVRVLCVVVCAFLAWHGGWDGVAGAPVSPISKAPLTAADLSTDHALKYDRNPRSAQIKSIILLLLHHNPPSRALSLEFAPVLDLTYVRV
eukprot:COSAG06_NODE_3836_length_4852_cov_13.191458_5_plen_146_part_00